MRARLPLSLLGACCLLCAGCLSQQVAADGQNFRQALLDMYTDQAMDNLINSANNLPFVQLDYKGLIVTDTQTIKANLGDESDPTSAKTFARKTRALLTAMHGYTNKLLYGATFDSNRQMQLSAEPISGKTDIYDYYIAFARDPSLFCSSEEKPCGGVHIAKKHGGRWYWVPADAARMFLELTLKTAFMRGPEPPPPIYWTTTIEDFAPQYDPKTGNEIPFKYVVTFSTEVPNDEGIAEVTLADGSKQKFGLFKLTVYPPVKGSKPIPVPDTVLFSRILYVTYDPTKNKPVDQLKKRPALVYSFDHPNQATKSPEAQRLEDLLINYRRSLNP